MPLAVWGARWKFSYPLRPVPRRSPSPLAWAGLAQEAPQVFPPQGLMGVGTARCRKGAPGWWWPAEAAEAAEAGAPGGGFTAADGSSGCNGVGQGQGGTQVAPGTGGLCDPYEPGANGVGMTGGAPSNTGVLAGGGGGGGSGWFGGGAGGVEDSSSTEGSGGGGGSDYVASSVKLLTDAPGGNTLTGGQPSDGGAVQLSW